MKSLFLFAILAAETPQQFDLDCSQPPPTQYASFAAPANVRFRVDLAAKRWCYADCRMIRPIADVQPSVIYFENETAEEKAHGLGTHRSVDRITGEYLFSSRFRILGRIHLVSEAAVCKPEPFSGFPAPTTQF